ncbi:DNA polymerase III subunit delta' [Qipengyuania atrilutea]|uniref:DNA polymerase III subunit delta n=1 Tax=Qipengyuania atrilutea TaxID=2744473 RepID=A0A850H0P9_9SPHN|nr:DNA polymerase III subunit delta' [Actirhodobacter atriluteus]NVD43822.1 DNA polymerase III subunit delta' [Actirhodobacter atriluteus]
MLVGHEAAWKAWNSATTSDRMHHAWLLTGRRGVGKMHFAEAAAQRLLETDRPAADHPDIIVLTHLPKDDKEDKKRAEGKPYELKRNIAIQQIRTMQVALTKRPTLGDRRVVIIDPADDMERNASNALLKSLEEPPRGCTFILISHHPARLLPTIRSRCRTLRFPPLGNEQLAALLRRECPQEDEGAISEAIAAAGGSPGFAISFLALDLAKAAAVMRDIAGSGDESFALHAKLAGILGSRPDRAKLQAALEVARRTLADGIIASGGRGADAGAQAHEELTQLENELATYNYDAGLLVMQIGTLLARTAASTKRSYA